jgi:hypothetical protein
MKSISRRESMKHSIVKTALGVAVMALGSAGVINAQEHFSGNLFLRWTVIKTHSTIVALPKFPVTTDMFSGTYVYCPPPGPCTLEVNVTSELSDISPGIDSLRFYLSVDGNTLDVHPTTNLGINSTAKTGQMESGSGTWMKRYAVPGYHIVSVDAAINDTNADGVVSGYIGDRSLVIRVYSNQ